MSQEKMSQEEAALFERVYVPAFVEKLAGFGRDIPDQETLQHAIELTANVKEAIQQCGSNSIKTANVQFKQAIGADIQEAEEKTDLSVKHASRRLAADPGNRKLLLSSQEAV